MVVLPQWEFDICFVFVAAGCLRTQIKHQPGVWFHGNRSGGQWGSHIKEIFVFCLAYVLILRKMSSNSYSTVFLNCKCHRKNRCIRCLFFVWEQNNIFVCCFVLLTFDYINIFGTQMFTGYKLLLLLSLFLLVVVQTTAIFNLLIPLSAITLQSTDVVFVCWL